MKKLSKLLFLLLAVAIASCSKNDKIENIPLRDASIQYTADLDSINKFIDTHYMTVTPDFDVTFNKIDASQESIRQQEDFPLKFKMVTKGEVEYKVYYINFREGSNRQPTKLDSVYVSYKGDLLTGVNFDAAQNPVWFQLDKLAVSGWGDIIPMFKTGFYDSEGDLSSPTSFTDYGAGVMFLPSGLGYFGNSGGGAIPLYSPLIFSFKLMELRYTDHDGDGILSKDEVANAGDNPELYDTDGDGLPNYKDADDDGDGYLTKFEIRENGVITFPTCPGGTLPKYLDPTCH
ncbi:MAG: FKBP-type peptidylprolyl isomerase [Flavobacterium sp.]